MVSNVFAFLCVTAPQCDTDESPPRESGDRNIIANHVNIIACVLYKGYCVLFKSYKFMKGRTGSVLSRTKYFKSFRVETSFYRVVLRLKFIVTVELLYDQAESDFFQCQTKMRAFASRIRSEFKQIELS